ncbi:unnamed protein product [Orchesella dallaii]|uniref:DIRP domain-containing protein n=1 Tax=Orchesella dallaii TaxID=48710 RepID=A0ABP1S9A4_9HEXA
MERRSNRGRPVTGKPRTRSCGAITSAEEAVIRGATVGGRGRGRAAVPVKLAASLIPDTSPEPFPNTAGDIYILADEIPVSTEEIVLNKRGMPVRHRKRNSMYFCDEMDTSGTKGRSASKLGAGDDFKKVKTEQREVFVVVEQEDTEDTDTEIIFAVSQPATPGRRTGSASGSSSLHASPRDIKPDPSTLTLVSIPEPQPRPLRRGGKEDRWTRMSEAARANKEWIHEEEVAGEIDVQEGARAGDKKFKLSAADKDKVDRRRATVSKSTASVPKKTVASPSPAVVTVQPQPKKNQQEASVSSQKKGQRGNKRINPSPAEAKQRKPILPKPPAVPLQSQLGKGDTKPVVSTPTSPNRTTVSQSQSITPVTRFVKPGSGQGQSQMDNRINSNLHTLQSSGLTEQQHQLLVEVNQRSEELKELSLRVRNFLKLPKSHKWVCYEWFYSTIDQVLFKGQNDFQMCLRESFPDLKTRKITRVEWVTIRRIMGKPRRCSQSFFYEEREELYQKRQKIREIQQRKLTDFNHKELPDEIPLQFVIGTKVTARLRSPQDGLFEGKIEGVDTSNNTYRIAFTRPGVGVHSVLDYEVASNEPVETVSTSSFALKIPRRLGGERSTVGNFKFQNPALLAMKPEGFPESQFDPTAMLGGFPIRLLDMIVQLSKLLKAKREKISQLRELNVKAEKMISYGKLFSREYRVEYARCVQQLDSLNSKLNLYMAGIQAYCVEIGSEPQQGGSTTGGSTSSSASSRMINSEQVLERCRQDAAMMVSNFNDSGKVGLGSIPGTHVKNQKILTLIQNAATMMLGIRTHSVTGTSPYEAKPLQDFARSNVKSTVEGKNLRLYEDRVEMIMNRMMAGLCVRKDFE